MEGSQKRILQIWLFLSTLSNTQTARLEHFDVQWKSFSWTPHLPTFCSFCFVVDGTVDGKDYKEEKTREVPDIRMYYFRCNFFQLGYELLQWWWLTTLSTNKLVVDDTVDVKDNQEKRTSKVADIRMYHLSWYSLQLRCDMLRWWWLTSFFYIFNICHNIKFVCVNGRQHCWW